MQRSVKSTRSRQVPVLVVLLVLTFAVAAALVHSAWRASRQQRETASQAVRDYAAYATWNAARYIEQGTGSSMAVLFRYVLMDTLDADEPVPSLGRILEGDGYARACDCVLVVPARYFFSADFRSGTIRGVDGSGKPAAVEPWVVDSLRARLSPSSRDFGFVILRHGSNETFVGYAPMWASGGKMAAVMAVVADAHTLSDRFFPRLMRERRFLPAGAAQAVPNDSLLRLTVTTPDGALLFTSSPPVEAAINDSTTTHEAASSLRVGIALRASAVQQLHLAPSTDTSIGGLTVLLLVIAAMVTLIVRELRREHELARMRSEFTASVSHELRTPLAQILLFGETLIYERTRTIGSRRAAAEVIVREARRLMRLVENALHFTRLERQLVALAPERVPLADAIRETLVGFAPLAWAADVTIRDRLAENPTVLIDRSAFQQLLLNLLDNAVKYGGSGTTVTITLGVADGYALLRVEDEGPGVAAEDRERIWQPFSRVEHHGRAGVTGTGIGLAVVRDLAVRHGGTVDVENGKRGACFIVTLPVAAPTSKDDDVQLRLEVNESATRSARGPARPSPTWTIPARDREAR
ncbi:MAG TPA: HAMP domain-containing sensor histidine kinase [Gemmatimonadaceae bacterium]|nr:HAMP domain-containing sensor histidine kinase [Gemmatimonadaceae bacterium]